MPFGIIASLNTVPNAQSADISSERPRLHTARTAVSRSLPYSHDNHPTPPKIERDAGANRRKRPRWYVAHEFWNFNPHQTPWVEL